MHLPRRHAVTRRAPGGLQCSYLEGALEEGVYYELWGCYGGRCSL